MSSSLLYRVWGLRDHTVTKTEYREGRVTLHVRPDRCRERCAACRSTDVVHRGLEERIVRTVPLGGTPVDLRLTVPRLGCRTCGVVRQAALALAGPFRRVTRLFERYALGLLSHMTIRAVAAHLQVGWDAIKAILKRRLQTHFGQPRLRHLKRIAIDEIAIGHGHRYLTVVLDLASGAVVFVGEGKGADALIPFWKRLKLSHAQIEAVATDLSPAYLFAVHEHLPDAVHVADHFHFVKLFNDRLAAFRRDLQREAEGGSLQQKVLKGTRWLILKNPDRLSEETGRGPYRTTSERERLDLALRINQPLATAYYFKEEFRHFWSQGDLATATRFLDDWVTRAEAACLKVMTQMATTVRQHRQSLLNYYRYPISTGPLEGINNKIKTLQRQAYGFRDQDFFRLRIYAVHLATYELLG